ncbi:LysR family transcriptional regulator [Sphingobium sp.]|uniref:LysR family transcriptional regulator n=1 Tax=Sphingobium sp. TaxID=1912891 RepID=UPI0028BD19B3|nr:LysR family transcriptional regulator [Sphingobium sp.]
MHDIYARAFDANLMRVFLAIWDARSLTIAADRLGLTQPAISHALKRLRERFDDPLFVRGPQGMVPTRAAIHLHDPFLTAQSAIIAALHDSRAFDPGRCDRSFRIAMSDISEVFFMPRLLSWLAATAPAVRIESVPFEANSASALLRPGDVDLVIGHAPELEDECMSALLFEDRLICLLRGDHPQAGTALTPETFANLQHIDAGNHAPGHAMVDLQLDAMGLRRTVAIKVRHLMTAPRLVRETDLAVIYPRSLAMELDCEREYCAMDLPVAIPRIEVKAYVHRSSAKQADIAWLTGGIRSLFT